MPEFDKTQFLLLPCQPLHGFRRRLAVCLLPKYEARGWKESDGVAIHVDVPVEGVDVGGKSDGFQNLHRRCLLLSSLQILFKAFNSIIIRSSWDDPLLFMVLCFSKFSWFIFYNFNDVSNEIGELTRSQDGDVTPAVGLELLHDVVAEIVGLVPGPL